MITKTIFLAPLFLFAGLTPQAFAQGTAENPTVLTTCLELDQARQNLGAYYVLGNNIDCSETSAWNAGAGWEPIGTAVDPFTGSLDGNGYEISGLSINRYANDNIGLFGVIGPGSEIRNIGVVSVSIAGDDIVGALAGNNHGTITDSHSTGTFSYTYSQAGGLVGHNNGVIHNCSSEISISVPSGQGGGLAGYNYGTITHSHATGAVSGYEYLGGLVGRNEVSGSIFDSYASGNIAGTGGDYIGGFVGENRGSINQSYATGPASGDDNIGGFVGRNDGGIIHDSYATGNATGTSGYVGGFVGANDFGAQISNSYSVGHVIGSGDVGGFAGYIWATVISNSFYDSETSGQSDTGKGEPKTTLEMKNITTFASAGWDFLTTWGIDGSVNNGYPYLLWHYSVGGMVSGLPPGDSIVLQNSLVDDLTVTADGNFIFPTALADGSVYAVSVLTQPTDSTVLCTVTNGTGTLSGKDVSNVEVTCSKLNYTVGGVVSGMAPGNSVVLQNNLGDDLTVPADGNFIFPIALDDGSAYAVTVLTQPTDPDQFCRVANGVGTLSGQDVSNVEVTCRDTFPWTMFLPAFTNNAQQ